jgi:hypothetical protein
VGCVDETERFESLVDMECVTFILFSFLVKRDYLEMWMGRGEVDVCGTVE